MNTNGALSWINAFDGAVLAASSEASGLPIGNLQSGHLSTKWRTAGDLTAWLTADFGAAKAIDVVGIFGGNFTSAATWRIRLSSTAAHAGDLLDTGTVAFAPYIFEDLRVASAPVRRSQAVSLMPTTVTARYLKIDLADSGPSYLEAGIAWAGPLFQPARNFSYGDAPALQDPSITTQAVGGAEYTDLRPLRRTDSFTFGLLSEAEHRQAQVMDASVGIGRNLLFVKNPALVPGGQSIMNQTAILGHFTALAPGASLAFDLRSRQFQIAERL